MSFTVDLEHMLTSALDVTGHGEDLATRHASADGRIEAAATGWVGRSVTALSSRSAQWALASTALLTRIGDHAQGLHTGALAYQEHEEMAAGAFTALRPAAH